MPQGCQAVLRRLEIGGIELATLGKAIRGGILTSAADQRLLPTPTTWAPNAAIGRLKLPRPQNRSAMRSPGRGSSSCIERRISRRLMPILTWVKVGRPESHRHAELRQRVNQARRFGGMQAMGRIRAARLQPDLHPRPAKAFRRAVSALPSGNR
jgi:hypothetical protein